MQSTPPTGSKLAALTLGAIGVVYGDIGTSPLYALKEVFTHGHIPVTQVNILGILSLVFWTLTVIVSIKYVVLILRADNNGEGGLVAMLALASMAVKDRPVLRERLLAVGIFGTAIFFGDGVITPAISVLSAVEGLEVAAPGLERFVVPITVIVLTGLFAVQKHGTTLVGKLFGPVTLVWLIVLAVLGLWHIARNPSVLSAVSPHHALLFIAHNPGTSFIALGAVVLCVTGGRGALRRHGPLRQAADPRGLVRAGDAGADAQLLRPGGDAAGASRERHQSLLRDGAEMGPLPAGVPGDRRHGDRLAGADLGGLLGHQADHPARLPAAPAHLAHLRARSTARSTCPSSTGGCMSAS